MRPSCLSRQGCSRPRNATLLAQVDQGSSLVFGLLNPVFSPSRGEKPVAGLLPISRCVRLESKPEDGRFGFLLAPRPSEATRPRDPVAVCLRPEGPETDSLLHTEIPERWPEAAGEMRVVRSAPFPWMPVCFAWKDSGGRAPSDEGDRIA